MDVVMVDAATEEPYDAFLAIGEVGLEQICGQLRLRLKELHGPRMVAVEGWRDGEMILSRIVANPANAVLNRST